MNLSKSMEQPTLNILVVDDDEFFADIVANQLREEYKYNVTIARTGQEAKELIATGGNTYFDIVLTDYFMPEMSGIDLLIKLHQSGLTLPVIVMTGHADVALAVHAMKQGAFDFIEKPFHAESLIAAVQRALDRSNGSSKASNARLAMLSSRENEVLNGLLQGKSNKLIGRDLNISERTVECHRANVMRKTGAGSVAELVRMAVNVK
jgi:two-component system, LuxR family, response regulator FixJ